MTETMIADLVEIQSGYPEYIDLRLELFNEALNDMRMSSYRPIRSHREAFQKLTKSYVMKDKRCYLLTGVYGTGKSHLCLILANFWQTPADEEPMRSFLQNYAAVDPEEAEKLRAGRAEGRFLVALCDWTSKGDFDEVVLRAVNTALLREGFADDLQTPYLHAHKKLEEWQGFAEKGDPRGNFYTSFEQLLQERNPEQTLVSFKHRLNSFDREALEEFRRLHLEITTAPFTYDKADLHAILTSILASPSFKDRFLGMLVLFDEFGDTMARGEMNPKAFQQFAQLCAETPSECAKLMFVGTSHKDFKLYAKSYNAMEFRIASDRIESVSLERDGVEDIISAIVTPRKESTLWQEKILPHIDVWDHLLAECLRLKVFDKLSETSIRTTIIENMYPMHPMATFALLRLVGDVASNNRSVFTFFATEASPDAPIGSFGQYVATTPIGTSKKLNLYTADRLFDYFDVNLKADNTELRSTIRPYLKDYENAVYELKLLTDQETQVSLSDDPLIARILRLLVIYQIIGLPPTLDLLQFGLYCTTPSERALLESRLRLLISKRIVFHMKETNIYEFKQSGGKDLDRYIEDYTREPLHQSFNIVAALNALVPLEKKVDWYLEAKEYNMPNGEDKRWERRFVRAVDLTDEVQTPSGALSYFATLKQEVEQEVSRKGEFEGIALYVVCETVEEIQRAKDGCTRNNSQRIVVAIPKQPVPLRDLLLEIHALKAIKENKEYELFSQQDKAALEARLHGDGKRQGTMGSLRIRRNKLMNGKEITWNVQYGQQLRVEENGTCDAVNQVTEQLYARYHNLFIHEDFNKVHGKGEHTRNSALKEAVEKFLDTPTPITIDTSFPEGRGEIKYLEKCFLKQDALVHVRTDGTKIYCDVETDPQKYASKLPALAAMARDISALKTGEKLPISEWILKYRQPPYGQGQIALTLMLAYLCRLFGDSIHIKHEETAVGDVPLRSFEMVAKLVNGQYPHAVLGYRLLQHEEHALINLIFAFFTPSASAVHHSSTAVEAYTVLKTWWTGLPSLATIETLYAPEQYPGTALFILVMQKIGMKDAHTFLLTDLPTAFGAGSNTSITQEMIERITHDLAREKQILESAVSMVEKQILDAVRSLYSLEQRSTSGELTEAIAAWYNNLDAYQQDTLAAWHSRESKPLLVRLGSIGSLQETFLTGIPTDYGLRPVVQWSTDRIQEYVERLKQGKMRIDDQKVKVEKALIFYNGHQYEEQEGPISFQEKVSLTFQHPKPNVKIYIAENQADPKDPTAARTQVNGTLPVEIQGNKLLRIATQDEDGNWSQVDTIRFINEQKKYEVSLPPFKEALAPEEMVNFVFPVDSKSFLVTCRSLIIQGLERNIVSLEALQELIQQLSQESQVEGAYATRNYSD